MLVTLSIGEAAGGNGLPCLPGFKFLILLCTLLSGEHHMTPKSVILGQEPSIKTIHHI